MKNFVLIAIAFFTLNVTAQEKETKTASEEKSSQISVNSTTAQILAEKRTKELTRPLDLSSDQQKSVYEAFLSFYNEEITTKEKFKEMLNSEKESEESKISAYRKSYFQKLDDKLKGILSEVQYNLYLQDQPTHFQKQKAKSKISVKKN